MKRIFSISILLVYMFNMTGFYIVFKVQQNRIRREIKHQIKAGIPEDELHFFSLSKQEYEQLDWDRPDKEFRKEGEMFDVVRLETSGDSIHLYCINDQEEAVLFVQLDKAVQKKMKQESNTPNSPINKVVKVSKLVYINNFTTYAIDVHTIKLASNFTESKQLYSSPYLEILVPPPDTV